MNVWILTECDTEFTNILGVYTTEAGALAAMDAMPNGSGYVLEVHQHTVDQPPNRDAKTRIAQSY